MSSTIGTLFRVTTFGESHGAGVGVVIDGCPPRLPLSVDDVQAELDRRRPGQSRIVTQRQESDTVDILSGVFTGYTTGTPICMFVRNSDAKSGAYEHMKNVYRPSHADYTYDVKYGFRDWTGGGRASARETVGRVAAAAVARKLLASTIGLSVLAWVSSVHQIDASVDASKVTREDVESNPTRCPDTVAARHITDAIKTAKQQGDSLGGVVECVCRNVPAGLGEPVFDKIEASLAAAMLSIPATKGFEIGSGFAGTRLTGKTHNDPFAPASPDAHNTQHTTHNHTAQRAKRIVTTTNYSGGVQGGITNGADITMRIAFKPTSTISSPQQTVDRSGKPAVLAAKGRHDACVLPRAVPIVEAMALLVIADHLLRQRAIDMLPHFT